MSDQVASLAAEPSTHAALPAFRAAFATATANARALSPSADGALKRIVEHHDRDLAQRFRDGGLPWSGGQGIAALNDRPLLDSECDCIERQSDACSIHALHSINPRRFPSRLLDHVNKGSGIWHGCDDRSKDVRFKDTLLEFFARGAPADAWRNRPEGVG